MKAKIAGASVVQTFDLVDTVSEIYGDPEYCGGVDFSFILPSDAPTEAFSIGLNGRSFTIIATDPTHVGVYDITVTATMREVAYVGISA